jgi:hypothetical protein
MTSQLEARLSELVENEKFTVEDLYEVYGIVNQFKEFQGTPLAFELANLKPPTNTTDLKLLAAKLRGLLRAYRFVNENATRTLLEFDLSVTASFALTADAKKNAVRLCSEIRKHITESDDFDESHKIRLMKKLGSLEQELQRKSGLLAVALSSLEEVGNSLGRFGESSKPFFDRVNDLRKTIETASNEVKQIEKSADPKQLPKPESSSET